MGGGEGMSWCCSGTAVKTKEAIQSEPLFLCAGHFNMSPHLS